MFNFIPIIGLVIGLGALVSFIYLFLKRQGAKEEQQRCLLRAVKEAQDVKKDMADHVNDDIDDVNKRLSKHARD